MVAIRWRHLRYNDMMRFRAFQEIKTEKKPKSFIDSLSTTAIYSFIIVSSSSLRIPATSTWPLRVKIAWLEASILASEKNQSTKEKCHRKIPQKKKKNRFPIETTVYSLIFLLSLSFPSVVSVACLFQSHLQNGDRAVNRRKQTKWNTNFFLLFRPLCHVIQFKLIGNTIFEWSMLPLHAHTRPFILNQTAERKLIYVLFTVFSASLSRALLANVDSNDETENWKWNENEKREIKKKIEKKKKFSSNWM